MVGSQQEDEDMPANASAPQHLPASPATSSVQVLQEVSSRQHAIVTHLHVVPHWQSSTRSPQGTW